MEYGQDADGDDQPCYSPGEVHDEIVKLENNRSAYKKVKGWAWHLLDDKPLGVEPADLIGEVYAALLSGRRKIPRRIEFVFGLFSVMRSWVSNELKDNETSIRRNSETIGPPTDGEDDAPLAEKVPDGANPEMEAHFSGVIKRVSAERSALLNDEMDRKVLEAKDMLGLTDQEIRKEYGLSQRDYDARCKRIKRKLGNWDDGKWKDNV